MPLLKDIPEIPTKAVREIIFDHLRQAIINGDLKTDMYFTDAEIAAEMGVSRTPVREAVQKLESEGYIERVPMKGNRVKGLAPQEVALSFSIRKALEILAIRYAAINISEDDLARMRDIIAESEKLFEEHREEERFERFLPMVRDFNLIAFNACGSERLLALVWEQRDIFDRYRVMRTILPHRMDRSLARRKALYEAFAAHDPDKAASVWEEHLGESYEIWRTHSGFAAELEGFRVF